jgi:hypothetical protein
MKRASEKENDIDGGYNGVIEILVGACVWRGEGGGGIERLGSRVVLWLPGFQFQVQIPSPLTVMAVNGHNGHKESRWVD